MMKDIENHDSTTLLVCDYPPDIKAEFIKKVYSTLTMQLLFTCSLCVWFISDHRVTTYILNLPELNIIAIIISILSLISLHCCFSKHYPINIILLVVFTLSMSYEIGYICVLFNHMGKGYIILQTTGITTTIFIALISYVSISKQDFEFLGAYLYTSLIALVLFSFIFVFVPISHALNLILGFISTMIFSGFILYDTSQVIHKFGPDDYVEGTIQLYLDFINLFFSILKVMQNTDVN